jgi:DNA-binding response OmpR family regulator
LVEDDPLIAKTLRMSLPYKGFAVTVCDTVRAGLELATTRPFDVILLDVNLPDGNGLELCQSIRKRDPHVIILMLTAQTDEDSAVRGLEWGADDYVRKPYGVQELTARITRHLNRGKKGALTLRFGSIKVDPEKRLAWTGDTPLSLGKREFEILSLLVKRSGDAVTRNDILSALGEEADVYDRTIDSHLSHLRRKLKDAAANDVQILPIYGVGYRLELK